MEMSEQYHAPSALPPIKNLSTQRVDGLKVEPGTLIKRNVLSTRTTLRLPVDFAMSHQRVIFR
jgi:hypothetical protein